MTPEEAAKDDEHDSISHVYSEWMPLSGDGNWWADLIARNAWEDGTPIDKYGTASNTTEAYLRHCAVICYNRDVEAGGAMPFADDAILR